MAVSYLLAADVLACGVFAAGYVWLCCHAADGLRKGVRK